MLVQCNGLPVCVFEGSVTFEVLTAVGEYLIKFHLNSVNAQLGNVFQEITLEDVRNAVYERVFWLYRRGLITESEMNNSIKQVTKKYTIKEA